MGIWPAGPGTKRSSTRASGSGSPAMRLTASRTTWRASAIGRLSIGGAPCISIASSNRRASGCSFSLLIGSPIMIRDGGPLLAHCNGDAVAREALNHNQGQRTANRRVGGNDGGNLPNARNSGSKRAGLHGQLTILQEHVGRTIGVRRGLDEGRRAIVHGRKYCALSSPEDLQDFSPPRRSGHGVQTTVLVGDGEQPRRVGDDSERSAGQRLPVHARLH